ncbi:MAG: cytochrome c3 family protein [Sumerlaeia bacterium]
MNLTAKAVLSRWRLMVLVAVGLVMGGAEAYKLTNNKGYEPLQPIPYSHALHAGLGEGQLGMDCLYCHGSAEVSKHAGVPSVDTCMGCHSVVRTDRENIIKLTEYYESGESIPWVRIHSVPDHVYFNHAQHVAAGVDCQTCHGPIEEMEVVYQYVDLSMGWCMACHRNDDYIMTPEKQAQYSPEIASANADNTEYQSVRMQMWNADQMNSALEGKDPVAQHELIVQALGYDHFARQAGNGVIDHVKAFQNASLNCITCHY